MIFDHPKPLPLKEWCPHPRRDTKNFNFKSIMVHTCCLRAAIPKLLCSPNLIPRSFEKKLNFRSLKISNKLQELSSLPGYTDSSLPPAAMLEWIRKNNLLIFTVSLFLNELAALIPSVLAYFLSASKSIDSKSGSSGWRKRIF